MGESSKILMLLAAGMSAAILLAMVPAFIYGSPAEWADSWIVAFFADVCHQQPNRMFEISDSYPAICSRCTGIYAGFSASLWLASLGTMQRFTLPRKPVIMIILFITFVIGFDILAQWINWWEGSNIQRATLGLFWSTAIVSIFVTNKKSGPHGN